MYQTRPLRINEGQIAKVIMALNTRDMYSKEEIARMFAEELAKTNPKFSSSHFLRAAIGTAE